MLKRVTHFFKKKESGFSTEQLKRLFDSFNESIKVIVEIVNVHSYAIAELQARIDALEASARDNPIEQSYSSKNHEEKPN